MGVPNPSTLEWPFNMASYEALCPENHKVKMSTGYLVHAPDEWTQIGECPNCNRILVRQVGMAGMDFVAGPVHWQGEDCAAEKIWRHDVLRHHQCVRCQVLGMNSLIKIILDSIEGGVGIADIKRYLLSQIEKKVD